MTIHSKRRYASILHEECVACGTCVLVCPRDAIAVSRGTYAVVNEDLCVGCGICKKACPASVIEILINIVEEEKNKSEAKKELV